VRNVWIKNKAQHFDLLTAQLSPCVIPMLTCVHRKNLFTQLSMVNRFAFSSFNSYCYAVKAQLDLQPSILHERVQMYF
jgi:hypothetical protein